MKKLDNLFTDAVALSDMPMEGDSDIDNILGIPSEPFVQTDPLQTGN